MNLDDTLRLHALQLKQLNNDGVGDGGQILDRLMKEAPEGTFRNVCALISSELFNELDGLCGLLEISKRLFIELAIVEAIKKAASVMEEVRPLDQETR